MNGIIDLNDWCSTRFNFEDGKDRRGMWWDIMFEWWIWSNDKQLSFHSVDWMWRTCELAWWRCIASRTNGIDDVRGWICTLRSDSIGPVALDEAEKHRWSNGREEIGYDIPPNKRKLVHLANVRHEMNGAMRMNTAIVCHSKVQNIPTQTDLWHFTFARRHVSTFFTERQMTTMQIPALSNANHWVI
jgi:hypothetical protein